MKHAHVILVLMLCLLSAPALSACAGNGATSGVKAKLEPGPTAPLGGAIPFRLTVSYPVDAPNTDGATDAEAYVQLSPGLSLVEPKWSGLVREDLSTVYTQTVTFKANVQQTFDLLVKLDQPGEHRIDAGAVVHSGNSGQDGNSDIKLLNVSSSGTSVCDMPLAEPIACNP